MTHVGQELGLGLGGRLGDVPRGDQLGFEAAVTSPFSDETPSTIELAELYELFGSFDPVAVSRAIKLGVIVPDGARLRVPSMRLLRAGAELHRAGIPLSALFAEMAVLRERLDAWQAG